MTEAHECKPLTRKPLHVSTLTEVLFMAVRTGNSVGGLVGNF